VSIKDKLRFYKTRQEFQKAGGVVSALMPIYKDYRKQAGTATGHYFHQDLLVAGYVHQASPKRHIDIGSSIEGFVAHVASFRPIEVCDVRALADTGHPNISFKQMDLMDSAKVEANACDSLSCLHAIEHFGLGRYGDPINPNGHIDGFKNLLKMLAADGTLYISFPIGNVDKVVFNAHRVFAPKSILGWQSEVAIEVVKFSYVDDAGNLHREVGMDAVPLSLQYGCGIYSIVKAGSR
jgi:hypothetical protein